MTGGRCSEVDLVLKLLRRDLEWSLSTGGCCSEVVVSTGLNVKEFYLRTFLPKNLINVSGLSCRLIVVFINSADCRLTVIVSADCRTTEIITKSLNLDCLASLPSHLLKYPPKMLGIKSLDLIFLLKRKRLF